MSWVNIGVAAVGIGTSLYNSNKQAQATRDAGNAAANALGANTNNQTLLDYIQSLNDQATKQSIANAQQSKALEAQLTPETQQLRTDATRQLINQMYPDPYTESLRVNLNTPGKTGNPLLDQAYAVAQQQLNLGGKLDQETLNQVMRASAARAGSVGQNLGLGRDLSAQDLGLTSLQLQQQRLAQAQQAAGAGTQDILARLQGQNAVGVGNYQRALSAAQLGQSIPMPQVGLNPGSVADISNAYMNLQAQSKLNEAYLQALGAKSGSDLGAGLLGAALPGAMKGLGGLFGGGNAAANTGGFADTGATFTQGSTGALF